MKYKVVFGDERDDYYEITRDIINRSWPEFMMHDRYIDKYWDIVFPHFPEYQFALLDESDESVIAVGNSFGLQYDGDFDALPEKGLDWALEKSARDIENKIEPNVQCAFQIVIDHKLRGSGLSFEMVKIMTSVGRKLGIKKLIAPVRPNQKCFYPLTPIDNYVEWKNESGQAFDAWLRVHQKLGARIANVCHQSMDICGACSEWEEWTGLKFPESGEYIVTSALTPVTIDIRENKGQYFEPNVWMIHSID